MRQINILNTEGDIVSTWDFVVDPETPAASGDGQYEKWKTMLGPGREVSIGSADDAVYLMEFDHPMDIKGFPLHNQVMLSSEGAIGLYHREDSPTSSRYSVTIPNVSRMYFTRPYPPIALVFHPPTDCRYENAKYYTSSKGTVLSTVIRRYNSSNYQTQIVALFETHRIRICFYRQSSDAGYPLFWVNSRLPATTSFNIINQETLVDLFVDTPVGSAEAYVLGDVREYIPEGKFYTQPIELPDMEVVTDSRVRWEASLPEGTSMAVGVALGPPGMNPETLQYVSQENNMPISVIPEGARLENKALYFCMSLSTSVPYASPVLHSLALMVVPEVDMSALHITFGTRFNNAEGEVTLVYDQNLGELSAPGAFVPSFEVTFTPTDLEPTPNIGALETVRLTAHIGEDFLDITPITYEQYDIPNVAGTIEISSPTVEAITFELIDSVIP